MHRCDVPNEVYPVFCYPIPKICHRTTSLNKFSVSSCSQDSVISQFIKHSSPISNNPFTHTKPNKTLRSNFKEDFCCVQESRTSLQLHQNKKSPNAFKAKLGMNNSGHLNPSSPQQTQSKRCSSCGRESNNIGITMQKYNNNIKHCMKGMEFKNKVIVNKSCVEYLGHNIIAKNIMKYMTFKEYITYLILSKNIYKPKLVSKKLTQLLINGIKNIKIRKKYWIDQCNIQSMINKSSHGFNFYCSKRCQFAVDIDKDVNRTFTKDHPFHKKPDSVNRLRKILRAFTVKHPEIGYIQGLNYIAGYLLVQFSDDVLIFRI